MDLQPPLGIFTETRRLWSTSWRFCKSPPPPPYSSSLKPRCSRGESQKPSQNGDNNKNNKGDGFSTDWDKAWSSFRKQGKKTLFSRFNPDKYVSWNPTRSNYPLSEEVDPIKRTERNNLMLWTSPRFTLAGVVVVVTLLLIYTILAPMK